MQTQATTPPVNTQALIEQFEAFEDTHRRNLTENEQFFIFSALQLARFFLEPLPNRQVLLQYSQPLSLNLSVQGQSCANFVCIGEGDTSQRECVETSEPPISMSISIVIDSHQNVKKRDRTSPKPTHQPFY